MKNNEYQTQDFYIATVLICSRLLTLKKLEKVTGNHVTFIFHDPACKAEEVIKNHWDRKNKVISKDLIEAINMLKTRIYTGI